MPHAAFLKVLSSAVVCRGQTLTASDRSKDVRVQWDPERGPALGILPYRSIQIGISGETAKWWVEEGIAGIEDVTERAKSLWEDVVEPARKKGGEVLVKECVERELLPEEREYVVPEDVAGILGIETEMGRKLFFSMLEESRKQDLALADAAKVGLALPEKRPPLLGEERDLPGSKKL
jgi:Domain of unknown function (DUF4291)